MWPPRTRKAEIQVWTPAQAARFLEVTAGHRLHPLFTLALSTGMRRGELLGLEWGDVDLGGAGGELTVRHNLVQDDAGHYVVGAPKTEAGHRRLLLPADVTAVLADHRSSETRTGVSPEGRTPVFTTAERAHLCPRNLRRTYRQLMAQAQVPRIRFHDLRHICASLLIRQGVPAKLVADRLGHTDPAFTLRVYTHLFDDQRAAAALPMHQLLGLDRSTPKRPEVPVDPQPGLEALRQLYTAIGQFLETAPSWATELLG